MNDTTPIPMLLWCPTCGNRHIDEGEFATKPHHTHACQTCGMVWRPSLMPTVGVQFLPGFRNKTMMMPSYERCKMMCPHGDQCILEAGHTGQFFEGTDIPIGCQHIGCDCNYPNKEPSE